MNADSIKDLCFGIVGAQAAAAQAAHDARQPEVDRLKALMARVLKTYDAMQAAPLTGPNEPFRRFHDAIEDMRAAIANAERAK